MTNLRPACVCWIGLRRSRAKRHTATTASGSSDAITRLLEVAVGSCLSGAEQYIMYFGSAEQVKPSCPRSLSDKLPATRQTVEHFVHQSARDDQMRSALPYVLLLCLWGCLQLPPAVSQAVTAGEHLDKTPLFPNGLSESTDLTKLLPNQEYSFAASSDSGSNCFASGGTDECAKAGSTWSVNKVTYNDKPRHPDLRVCVRQLTVQCGEPGVRLFIRKSPAYVAYHSMVSTKTALPPCTYG